MSQNDAASHEFVHWHPIPKLPEELLTYSHPKMRDYIHELVGAAEAIVRENKLLQNEITRLTDLVKTYQKRLLQEDKSTPSEKDSHNSSE